MTNENSPWDDPHPRARPDSSEDQQRRTLELQLIKIRKEAEAARLEARAAEIELMLRQLGASGATTSGPDVISNSPHDLPNQRSPAPSSSFASWDDVRAAMPIDPDLPNPLADESGVDTGSNVSAELHSLERIEGSHAKPPPPHFRSVEQLEQGVARIPTVEEGSAADVLSNVETNADVETSPAVETNAESAGPGTDIPFTSVSGLPGADAFLANLDDTVAADCTAFESAEPDVGIQPDAEIGDDTDRRRSRPAALLISSIAHVGVLLILAAVTLQAQQPKDQVALSASRSEANEVSIETFTIESSEPVTEPSEPTPSETQYDLSPVGEISVTDFAPQAPPAPPSAAAASLSSSSQAAAAMSLKSESDAKIQFCGVEGGGNHFVYLVDSSGSMGDAFESARDELLRSIDVLKDDQRFYVIFFDADPDYMRLSDANVDEPRSVNATAENKAALKRWAMRISKDRGKAPYDPLRFALKLKADVVFLLSDGEFPQGIEDLLKEENKNENLFGDSNPISIVHTIGYYSKEGESRMRRIASQNKGQYRYIPKP